MSDMFDRTLIEQVNSLKQRLAHIEAQDTIKRDSSTGLPYFPSLTTGSVLFAGVGGLLSQDNANLFWDDTNNRLGVGTATPLSRLHVEASQPDTRFTHTDSTQYDRLLFFESSTLKGIIEVIGSTFATTARREALEIINASTTGVLSLWTNTTQRMTIDATGQFGFGTISPNGKMVVVGSSEPSTDSNAGIGLLRLATGTGANTDESLIFGVHDTDYSWIQAVKAGTANRNLLLNPNAGFVGINKNNPAVSLDVGGEIRSSDKIRLSGVTDMQMYMQSSAVVNTGVLTLATVSGIILIYDSTGAGAIFTIRGAGTATQEMVDPNGVYSVTVGTGSSTNIYWDAGSSSYRLQNNRGSTVTYHLYFMA